jgi:putative two-component system response regulator
MEGRERVLVVDDEEGVRKVIGRVLDAAGFSCRGVASAEAARQALAEEDFSLMLVDLMMPGESGIDLLNDASIPPGTATMVVSGYDEPNLACSVLERGAMGFLAKPFSNEQLVLTALSCLYRKKVDRALTARCLELELELESVGRDEPVPRYGMTETHL